MAGDGTALPAASGGIPAASGGIPFGQLGVAEPIRAALAAAGITTAFPIQALTLPIALAGHDVIGQARTGTGKTLAFGLPILQHVLGTARGRPATPRALVVVPTRELAIQVAEDLRTASAGCGVQVVTLYGGRAYEPQIEALAAVDVVVGTPGRLLDLARQRQLDLSGVAILVLDEADRMLDLGFLPDVEAILRLTPPSRQTMLFSATMPGEVVTLAKRHLRRPTHIRAEQHDEPAHVPTTDQHVFRTHHLDKIEVLARVLQARGRGLTIVFSRTRRSCDQVTADLAKRGFAVAAVHGDLGQSQRERALRAFRAGKIDVLVATDVAARGLDVERVSHVLNYDIPHDTESYVHRIGRTGRAGRSGTALLFVSPRERHLLKAIEKATRQKLVEAELPTVDDVNAQRVAKFADSITDALGSPGVELFRSLVEDYEREHNVPMADIAAALALQSRNGEEFFMAPEPPEPPRPRRTGVRTEGRTAKPVRKPGAGMATYRIGVGKRHRVGPGAIVGAIANEGGLHRSDFGHITIGSDFSLVELPARLPRATLKALEHTRISGIPINLRPDRATRNGPRRGRAQPRRKPAR